jgi:predicted transposase
MQRTIRILLEPSLAQANALAETSRQFTAVFNAVCTYGWQQRQKNGVALHRALYYPLKADYPDLVSDLHIQARVGYPLGADRSGEKRTFAPARWPKGEPASLSEMPTTLQPAYLPHRLGEPDGQPLHE